MSQSNDIVCRLRPFACFTCPYRECRNGSSPSREENEYLKRGIEIDEQAKEARRRRWKREWAQKNRRLKNGKAVH